VERLRGYSGGAACYVHTATTAAARVAYAVGRWGVVSDVVTAGQTSQVAIHRLLLLNLSHVSASSTLYVERCCFNVLRTPVRIVPCHSNVVAVISRRTFYCLCLVISPLEHMIISADFDD
jgi:hypothetical protein